MHHDHGESQSCQLRDEKDNERSIQIYIAERAVTQETKYGRCTECLAVYTTSICQGCKSTYMCEGCKKPSEEENFSVVGLDQEFERACFECFSRARDESVFSCLYLSTAQKRDAVALLRDWPREFSVQLVFHSAYKQAFRLCDQDGCYSCCGMTVSADSTGPTGFMGAFCDSHTIWNGVGLCAAEGCRASPFWLLRLCEAHRYCSISCLQRSKTVHDQHCKGLKVVGLYSYLPPENRGLPSCDGCVRLYRRDENGVAKRMNPHRKGSCKQDAFYHRVDMPGKFYCEGHFKHMGIYPVNCAGPDCANRPASMKRVRFDEFEYEGATGCLYALMPENRVFIYPFTCFQCHVPRYCSLVCKWRDEDAHAEICRHVPLVYKMDE